MGCGTAVAATQPAGQGSYSVYGGYAGNVAVVRRSVNTSTSFPRLFTSEVHAIDETRELIGGFAETPGHLIRRAYQVHTQLWGAVVPAHITGSQYAILAALAIHGDLDQAAVGRLTSLDRSSVAELAGRMTNRGLIERLRDGRDARRRLLHLTAAGARTVAEAAPAVHSLGERLLAPLDEGERARFLDLLRRVADAAGSS